MRPAILSARGAPLCLALALLLSAPPPALAAPFAASALSAPLPSTADWSSESSQDVSFYGWEVNTAGDVNGDGYSDVLVGCKNFDHPQIDNPSHTIGNGGLMRLYLGSANGVAATPVFEVRGEGESDENGQVGFSCQTAGDVNGDGFDDIIVSEPKRDTPGGGEGSEGRVLLFLGTPTGVDPDTAWTFLGVSGSRAELGNSVGTAGDVNGDGYADVIVSAQDMDVTVPNQGRVYVFYGSASGLPATPSWVMDGPLESGSWFGGSCHGVGDVNGDGYDDVGIGAPFMNGYSGSAWIYLGSASGLQSSPSWSGSGTEPGAGYGFPINRAGDVNGDGYADVIVGESRFLTSRDGSAHVYFGGPAGLSLAAAWTVSGAAGSCFGMSAGTAGDVNGDGLADLLVGAPDWVLDFDPLNTSPPHRGTVSLYLGTSTIPQIVPAWTVTGDEDNATLGRAVAAAGDVNGDGFGDVIIGAPGRNNGGPLRGRAYVYHGRGGSPSAAAGWPTESNQPNARQGSVVIPAGDVNGDSYADVLISAPLFDNTFTDEGRVTLHLGSATGIGAAPVWTAYGGQSGAEFGRALAGGGDVNGDGYADVLVGAPNFTEGETGEGRAVLYLGTPSPPYLTEAWSVQGNRIGAHLGQALAMIGDINGDGISDVALGAPGDGVSFVGEGRVQVHTGSSFGLGRSPIWSRFGGATGAGFGAAVADAGDLDGDGYSELVVGSPGRDGAFVDQGRVSVYRGGPAGLETAAWFTADGVQSGERLGAAVAHAGDLDGDGLGDLAVGSPGYSGGAAGEGRVQIWRGGTVAPSLFDEVLGGHATDAFGSALAGGADLNGDGLSDLIVGSPGYDGGQTDEGRVCLFFGGSAGVATVPDWSFELNQTGAMLGSAVAGGADLTGDGFGDILAGAPFYSGGQTAEGECLAFFGNTGRGPARRINQYRVLAATPIAPLGRSDVFDSFRLQSLGRSPGGRGRVRMLCEARPLLTPFGGTPSATTSFQNTGAPQPGAGSSVALQATLSGLLTGRAYRWRVRFETSSPFFPRTPWLSSAHNGPGETDLLTGAGLTAVDEDVPRPDPATTSRELRVIPNPVATRALFRFELGLDGRATLEVFDVQGRALRSEPLGWLAAGVQTVTFDAAAAPMLAPGVYFARVRVAEETVATARFAVTGLLSR